MGRDSSWEPHPRRPARGDVFGRRRTTRDADDDADDDDDDETRRGVTRSSRARWRARATTVTATARRARESMGRGRDDRDEETSRANAFGRAMAAMACAMTMTMTPTCAHAFGLNKSGNSDAYAEMMRQTEAAPRDDERGEFVRARGGACGDGYELRVVKVLGASCVCVSDSCADDEGERNGPSTSGRSKGRRGERRGGGRY